MESLDFEHYDAQVTQELTGPKIHVRMQVLKGKKLTIIETQVEKKEAERMAKKLKKFMSCGGFIKKIDENDEKCNVYNVMLNGDHRDEVFTFLTKSLEISSDNIVIHGG